MFLALPRSDYILLSLTADSSKYFGPFSFLFLLKDSPRDNYKEKRYEKTINKKEKQESPQGFYFGNVRGILLSFCNVESFLWKEWPDNVAHREKPT